MDLKDRNCSFACFYHVGEMSFNASSKCKKQVEWHHRSDVGLRVATFSLIFDSKHAGRKRKIYLACPDRIAVEEKCQKLGDLNVNANSLTSVVTVSQIDFHLFCDKTHLKVLGILCLRLDLCVCKRESELFVMIIACLLFSHVSNCCLCFSPLHRINLLPSHISMTISIFDLEWKCSAYY